MNTASIRQKIIQAIVKMPTSIELKRYEKTPDGIGGYTVAEEPSDVHTFDGLLDNSKHSYLLPVIAEGGTVDRKRTFVLIAPYYPEFTILKDDYFEVAGTTYTIKNPVNILNLNIYWECDLEVTNNG